MLAKFAPRFVISRVIQSSYLAENATIELLKIPLGYSSEHQIEQPGDFEV